MKSFELKMSLGAAMVYSIIYSFTDKQVRLHLEKIVSENTMISVPEFNKALKEGGCSDEQCQEIGKLDLKLQAEQYPTQIMRAYICMQVLKLELFNDFRKVDSALTGIFFDNVHVIPDEDNPQNYSWDCTLIEDYEDY
ncbi:MAG TPA: hypothetical protein VGE63_02760 [Candidatus Paceibacterota bacterium]